ncbi:uncharacterized protein LOC18433929 [Amborella trichopoda]|nr:uncharacterized protein LOC18433929 [Amborella trichopoda]XP_011623234.1 uncharacterized protein LOC18433929 [Amborella trichopoda]XP_011623235.1 uncharacterized protein LOC18433929 [Amborella trichopoda]XP_011623237.1 uncharacterized protein LOC18433929 [Amborella trichopoda]XP_020522785.1 uncharacterized protein LOC18433929 [Amborella trichopoda]|eukprot:XP_006844069.2 uncharacterized protein LOC18433929 [Amborella trichopoda]
MNSIRRLSTIFKPTNLLLQSPNPLCTTPFSSPCKSLHVSPQSAFSSSIRNSPFSDKNGILSTPHLSFSAHQWRGIRVQVFNGNLERALIVMQRKMVASGMERLIRRVQTHHLKNSEKRVLAKKNLERRIRSEDLARKLQSILIKKVRGL